MSKPTHLFVFCHCAAGIKACKMIQLSVPQRAGICWLMGCVRWQVTVLWTTMGSGQKNQRAVIFSVVWRTKSLPTQNGLSSVHFRGRVISKNDASFPLLSICPMQRLFIKIHCECFQCLVQISPVSFRPPLD